MNNIVLIGLNRTFKPTVSLVKSNDCDGFFKALGELESHAGINIYWGDLSEVTLDEINGHFTKLNKQKQ